jgi:site-specific DNA recombinase
MSPSVIYVRVSTEDQVEFSPDAQAGRCKDYGRQHGLGPFVVIADPGFTGSTLERPGMQELLELVEAGRVAHVIVWRLDRLSRILATRATWCDCSGG